MRPFVDTPLAVQFGTLSYSIDIYRRQLKPTRDLTELRTAKFDLSFY